MSHKHIAADGMTVIGAPLPRWFDVLVAGIGLLLLSPLLLGISLAIVFTSRGPILHRAVRMGRGGEVFRLYKFRSMRAGADRIGSGITRAGDARITPLGGILRRFKLDELPQLVNVVRGDMSLVGPRPEDPRYRTHFPPALTGILTLRPGITSAASLAFRDESALLTSDDYERDYIKKILPEKLRIDLDYFAHAGVRDHIVLLFRTIRASLLT